MRYRHYILINKATLPRGAYEEICKIAPQARTSTPYGFHLQLDSELPDGGDVVRRITAVCAAIGLKNYSHTAIRWYGEEVRRSAELLVLGRQGKIQGRTTPERDEEGRLILLARNAKRSIKLGSVFPNHIIVSDKVRQVLEAAHFAGLRFGEVMIKGVSMRAPVEPFWELESSVVLPKIANTDQFVHPGQTEAEPFRGDYSRIILINDPPFNKGEVHYRRRDVEQIGPFDIARTFENYMETHKALVISQRFYQLALRNKIALNVDPVCIDPG